MGSFQIRENSTALPTIHVISDATGATARALAHAVAGQFGVTNPNVEVFSHARTYDEIVGFLNDHCAYHAEQVSAGRNLAGDGRILVFITLVDVDLSRRVMEYAASRDDIVLIDFLSRPIQVLSDMTGREPSITPGGRHVPDSHYFDRIDAIEFTISHDDGRNPQDLTKADIVLVGVSRSSKTPTSIYLAQQGYRVANVPLDPATDPPSQLFDVDRTRLFGLMTTPDVLVGIRRRRLGRAQAAASSYADEAYVYDDLEHARALMRRLGCIVVHTENKAVEETAQEILRYYGTVHPPSDMMG
ncbi:pyruvate, water dikinase regulatory protein [Adlercreutzia sp. ZJ141]|uniref:pyruvate, water dikinase regulatory protein n=1 Tax=Adlercreutzia sp. ZJ141 TaxID=2709406 RepID=UPI0013EAA2A7|nr:pyruvate, water dikinase regulatory protein [Adlercreutzia sp. ZJ141]